MLKEIQRKLLLFIARESIASALEHRETRLDERSVDDDLRQHAGAFVTLTMNGELRGCIGSIHPVAPLYRAVSMSAINAAFRDPRFLPLK